MKRTRGQHLPGIIIPRPRFLAKVNRQPPFWWQAERIGECDICQERREVCEDPERPGNWDLCLACAKREYDGP